MSTRIPILAYHGICTTPLPVPDWCFITRERFEAQLEFIAARYTVVPLRDVPARLQNGADDERMIAMTFDDGLSSYRSIALPLLARHGFHSTVFLATGSVFDGRPLWFCRVIDAVTQTRRSVLQWDEMALDLSSPSARANASARLQQSMKRLPANRLDARVDALVEALRDGDAADSPLPETLRTMTPSDIRELAANDRVDLGAHTVGHAILSHLTLVEQRTEIENSLRAVSNATRRPCDLFAYPNGTRADFTADTKRALADAGVRIAVTTESDAVSRDTDPLEIPRYCVGGDIDLQTFASRLECLVSGP